MSGAQNSASRVGPLWVDPGEAREVALALLEASTVTDGHTPEHARAVADLSRLVGAELGIGEGELEVLWLGALLHDVGKLGVPRAVLLKPGPLEGWELGIVRAHAEMGARMVDPLPCLRGVARAIRHHHERWDGGGYPDGLEGEGIPLGARVVAVADAYDAMVRGRPYAGGPRVPTEAVGELLGAAGSQFDAQVVAALARVVS